MSKRIEKLALPVIMEDDEPVAIVFYNKNRDRVIYILGIADEDDIINLFVDRKI